MPSLSVGATYNPQMPWARWAVLPALCWMLAGAGLVAQQPSRGGHPLVVVAEYDGIIHPIATEYLDDVLDQADSSGAALVIVVLRTPGGLVESAQAIVSRMIRSRAPVVVFVGPAGARAASAGFVLTLAADVAVMAPGTHIGAAHPVSGNGAAMDDVTARKAEADMAAWVRSLAEARHRNVMLAELAVTESRAFTDSEAAMAMPPLVDFVAADVAAIARRLDGQTVMRFDGRTAVVHTTDAEIRHVEPTRRQQFLGALAHPQIAYLLLTLGMLGLVVELWNPGATLPGVAGGLSLLLAFFAFQIVPVNTAGVLLIVFGLALLILEVKVPSFGALGVGGTISLLMGSLMITRTVPGVTVSTTREILPVVIVVAATAILLGRLALAAQRQPPASGIERMVGREGQTRTMVTPDAAGQIDIHGEIWRAVSRTAIQPRQPVRVLAVQGLTLIVEPLAPLRSAEAEPTKETL
jgi:membrane-bound serine protease (ClpP class)